MTNPHFEFLLSAVYDGPTRCDHPAHLADLRRSGLTDETIRAQRITDVPPTMWEPLLGFPAPEAVVSGYVIPFADPRGGWLDHVRIKVFPPFAGKRGETLKYLQPRGSGVRIFYPLATLPAVLHSDEPLYLVEGEKKSLAVAQTGVPAVGISGIEGWHLAGSRDLHPDFDDVGLEGRTVDIFPDADYRTNAAVGRAVQELVNALRRRGVKSVGVRRVPAPHNGVDEWLANS